MTFEQWCNSDMIVANGSLVVPGHAGLALWSLVHNVRLIFPLEEIIRRFKRNVAKRRLGILTGHGTSFQIGIDIRRVAHGSEFGFAIEDLSRGNGLRLPGRFVSQVVLGRIEVQVFLIERSAVLRLRCICTHRFDSLDVDSVRVVSALIEPGVFG